MLLPFVCWAGVTQGVPELGATAAVGWWPRAVPWACHEAPAMTQPWGWWQRMWVPVFQEVCRNSPVMPLRRHTVQCMSATAAGKAPAGLSGRSSRCGSVT